MLNEDHPTTALTSVPIVEVLLNESVDNSLTSDHHGFVLFH